MTPRLPRPLCAICADRIATTITDWECESGATRTIVACWPCLSPVPDPPEEFEPVDLSERCSSERVSARANQSRDHATRDAVLDAVRRLGEATTAAICEAIGAVDEMARATVGKQVSRLTRLGALRAVDLFPGRPQAGRIYSVTGASPLSEATRAVLAALPASRFVAADVGDPSAMSNHLDQLVVAGLVRVVGTTASARTGRTINIYQAVSRAI